MIGRTISHYKILEKIGEGGMGVVYKAEDTRLQRTVALKFLPAHIVATDEAKTRFVNEARNAAALHHPNICTVYQIDEADGQMFIAMAYIDGATLRAKLDAGRLPVDRALRIATQMARGLEEAHGKGIVHRDIKASNVIVDDKEATTIMDFGLAKQTGQTAVTKDGMTVGTVAYMSPEQARGDDVDHRTDIWSLGVCLYEMLSGKLPFDAENDQAVIYNILNRQPEPVMQYRADVPRHLGYIVSKALEKNRDDRYQSATELMKDLESPSSTTRRAAEAESKKSIAVLPFTNMSADREQDYFCDGIAEDITNDLTKLESLQVAARTSAFAFKGVVDNIQDIGRKLGVETVLEGSVRKSGNRLRITAQLVNVDNGYHIWSERYDRELEDVFEIQDEIASNIVQALKVQLGDKEKQRLVKTTTRDIEAYDLYLRGRRFFYIFYAANLGYAIDCFEQAIDKDPTYALAYAGLANCHSFGFMYGGTGTTAVDKAMAASKKAVELDPDLAEARAAKGLAISLRGSYSEAEEEFRKAIELNPNLFEAYYFFGRNCHAQGDHERAVVYYEKASRADPEDYQALLLAQQSYNAIGRHADARRSLEESFKIAKRRVEREPENLRARYLGALALADLGRKEEALEWAKQAAEFSEGDPAALYALACLHAKIGNQDEALDFLERTVDGGFQHKDWIAHDPDFDAVRDHPRYRAMIDSIPDHDER